MKRTKTFALVALAAFIANAVLPFFAVYNFSAAQAMAAEQHALPALFGEKILICTAGGFKLVDRADLESGREKPQPHPDYQCALCYVAANGQSLAPSDAAVTLAPPASRRTSRISAVAIFLAEHSWQKFLTRSPPVSFAG